MGHSGLQLSLLSFGSWVSFHKQIDDGVADELMGISYDNGINFSTMLKPMRWARVKK
jgi:aryl-alcohol dehydrogenase-like predicted oxidoreductase